MKSREISRSKIGPFSLACTDPYIGIGWEYQSTSVSLVPLLVVSTQFLWHFGPSWVTAAPSSGHLDPLTIPVSFFRESKALLSSTIIFSEDTSCYKYNLYI